MMLFDVIIIFLSLFIAVSIVWTRLQTGISLIMSSRKAQQAMLDSIESFEKGTLVDLGSAWGTLVIAAAIKYPNQQVIGYELSWFPWLISIIRKHCLRLDNLTLYRQDFRKNRFIR